MAMRIVAETARLMGADRLLSIESAHIDGALYHGDSGTLFAEALVSGGAKVAVRATLNVGAIDLTGCSRNQLPAHEHAMATRMMQAYRQLGCEPTWTCAPYQAGHRPVLGSQVAWGESNAVAFCNSVLGARTNRYGDFLDIACAIAGRAPDYGLHRRENRYATVVFDVSDLDEAFLMSDVAWPVLGNLYGRVIGNAVGVISGLRMRPWEDLLKAFGATAASSGSVALFHVAGTTPEAPDEATALGHRPPRERIRVTLEMVRDAQRRLSTTEPADRVDAVAIGSPHLSLEEFDVLARPPARPPARGAALCLHRTPRVEDPRTRWPSRRPGGERRGDCRGHLRGGDADPSGETRRHPDDQLRKVRTLRAGQHGLLGVVRLAGGMRGKRGGGKAGHGRDAVTRQAEVLLPGSAVEATAMALTAPISFWGGVNPKTAEIADARHPEFGQRIAGRVLLIPATIGSSSAAAILLELVHAGLAPAAVVLHEPDAILLLGLIVAREMGYPAPMALRLDAREFAALDGQRLDHFRFRIARYRNRLTAADSGLITIARG